MELNDCYNFIILIKKNNDGEKSFIQCKVVDHEHVFKSVFSKHLTFIQLFLFVFWVRRNVMTLTRGGGGGKTFPPIIWGRFPVTRRRNPSMVCLSRVWLRGSAFAAHFARKKCVCTTARYHSTKTAPQLPGMEYQVGLRPPLPLPYLAVSVPSAHSSR